MVDESKPKKLCYRCARPADVQYMGLDYCWICREVIISLAWLIVTDPPFGFPGAKGYLSEDGDPFEKTPPAEKKEDASG